jgi:hypothetical protein
MVTGRDIFRALLPICFPTPFLGSAADVTTLTFVASPAVYPNRGYPLGLKTGKRLTVVLGSAAAMPYRRLCGPSGSQASTGGNRRGAGEPAKWLS